MKKSKIYLLTTDRRFDILNTLFEQNNATIAQVVERIIGNDEVTGPTPVSSFFFLFKLIFTKLLPNSLDSIIDRLF